MGGPRDYHTKWSESDRERQIYITWLICGILKYIYKSTYLQNRSRLIDIENKLIVTKGERGGGEVY